jgi:glucosylceramidase
MYLISSSPATQWKTRPVSPARSGSIDLSVTEEQFQSWEGFGGCFNELGAVALAGLPLAAQQRVMHLLFDPRGCDFSLCRVPIGASDYACDWYSCNEQAGDFGMKRFSIKRDTKCLIPYIKKAQRIQPRIQIFASPWSPPAWMKNPPVYNYGTFIRERRYLSAYALYFLKFVKAYRKEGIPVTQVHVQNEPVADQKFPSCLWTGAEMRDFIRDHLGPLFKRAMPDCEIWLGTLNTGDYNGFPNTVLSDDKARRFISGVGFQWDGKHAVQRTAQSWPQMRLMQTENECGDGRNTWEYAFYIFDLLRHYITNGVNAYVYWNMLLPPGGKSTWGWLQNAMITIDPDTRKITCNPEYFVMKHFAHFIKPGAIRLGTEGRLSGNAVAFRNPDASIVAVINNPFAGEQRVTLAIGGVRVGALLEAQSIATLRVKPQTGRSLE